MKDADDEQRQAIALFRYGVIADLVHLPLGSPGITAQLREKAEKVYSIPGTRRTRVAGILGDIGSHIIDLAEWITGQRITGVLADLNTFTPERPLPGGDGMGKVDVDDAASLLSRFDGGGMGTFLATCYATGESMDQHIEIYGQKGSMRVSYRNQETIDAALGGERMQTIPIPDEFKVSSEHNHRANVRNFVGAIVDDTEMVPNFTDGLRNQRVLDAVVASSQAGTWVQVRG